MQVGPQSKPSAPSMFPGGSVAVASVSRSPAEASVARTNVHQGPKEVRGDAEETQKGARFTPRGRGGRAREDSQRRPSCYPTVFHGGRAWTTSSLHCKDSVSTLLQFVKTTQRNLRKKEFNPSHSCDPNEKRTPNEHAAIPKFPFLQRFRPHGDHAGLGPPSLHPRKTVSLASPFLQLGRKAAAMRFLTQFRGRDVSARSSGTQPGLINPTPGSSFSPQAH